MQLTKFKHACFTATKDTSTIVVDPGTFSTDFVVPDNVVAVVVTHQHPDHLDTAKLQSIIDRNPKAVIFADTSLLPQLSAFATQAVEANESVKAGPFNLRFFGGKHATIRSSISPVANLGVLINDALYYPGDSFVLPNVQVDTLALPACAPWMKIDEAIEFLQAVHPRAAFPTHDAILSDDGKAIYDFWFTQASQEKGILYQRITTPIEIKTTS